MHTILREKTPTAYPTIDYYQWQKSMHERLQHWYEQVSQVVDVPDDFEMPTRFELTFQRALLYLYRPSPMLPDPSDRAMIELEECSVRVIILYKEYFRGNRIHLFWQAADNIFDAGTALLFAYANSEGVRHGLEFNELANLILSASNLLWALVERFPALTGKRDAFEVIASSAMSELGSKGIASSHNVSEAVRAGATVITDTIDSSLSDVRPGTASDIAGSEMTERQAGGLDNFTSDVIEADMGGFIDWEAFNADQLTSSWSDWL
ncbi:hypothetical protein ANO11243_039740 [Dothideomycetidae sp. 11243]|nr:hypothetical protein ANO11243_039740 [fungal sp. No.11243]